MKAVVLKSPRNLELMEVPEPTLTTEEQVLIKVMACGICGSDLRYLVGENPWAQHTLGHHVDNPPNIILGHEFAGQVVKVNSRKHDALLGRRVSVQPFRSCGVCHFCRTGRENLCADMIHIGHAQGWGKMDYYPGAYAEYCLGWADLVHTVPEHVTCAEAAMADILCVAVHVIKKASLYPGAVVLCIGGGPIGLSIAQTALLHGAERVYVSDPSPLARSVVSAYDGLIPIDPTTQSVAEIMAESGAASRCAAVFDSVSSTESFETGIAALAESGTYVDLAVHAQPRSYSAVSIGSERTITTSSNAHYRDVIEACELINTGKADVKPWLTHRIDLADFQSAFSALTASPKQAFKVVLEPWSTSTEATKIGHGASEYGL